MTTAQSSHFLASVWYSCAMKIHNKAKKSTKRVALCLSEAEWEACLAAASQDDYTIATWIRRRALGLPCTGPVVASESQPVASKPLEAEPPPSHSVATPSHSVATPSHSVATPSHGEPSRGLLKSGKGLLEHVRTVKAQ